MQDENTSWDFAQEMKAEFRRHLSKATEARSIPAPHRGSGVCGKPPPVKEKHRKNPDRRLCTKIACLNREKKWANPFPTFSRMGPNKKTDGRRLFCSFQSIMLPIDFGKSRENRRFSTTERLRDGLQITKSIQNDVKTCRTGG